MGQILNNVSKILRTILELHVNLFWTLIGSFENFPSLCHSLPCACSVSRILKSASGFGRQIGPIGCDGERLFYVYISVYLKDYTNSRKKVPFDGSN